MPDIVPLPTDYAAWLAALKLRIHSVQQRASLAVNRELVLLYWQIGQDILQRQQQQGWGAKVIERLAQDLRSAFPDMKGFSPRNLKYMRAFAEAWTESEFVQAVLAQLPWYHHLALLDKLKTEAERRWYVAKALEHNWSRNVMVMQIERQLMPRSGQAVTNFSTHLPAPQSDLARESLKDPYRLDFLGLAEDAQERSIESAIDQHITKFLIELGAGFAYVGRQVHLEVGGDDGEHDGPTIGLLLCKSKNKVVAEYALRDMRKPIGVAEYQLLEALPADLQSSLPSIDAIEQALTATAAPKDEPA